MAWILLRPSNYKQVAPLVRTGGSRHTGLAALPHRNIQGDKPNYKNTFLALEGLWQRLSLLFMYLPLGCLMLLEK